VAIRTEGPEVDQRVNHAFAPLGDRVKVMNLNIGTRVFGSVKGIEVETTGDAGSAMHPDGNRAIPCAALVSAAEAEHFPSFHFPRKLVGSVGRFLGGDVCLGLNFCIGEFLPFSLEPELECAGGAFMSTQPCL
jgi:hypothetical protein